MGQFVYDSPSLTVEFEDRVLSHLKAVITTKLRRGESFLFTLEYGTDSGSGHSSVWLHPAIPLRYEFSDSRDLQINRQWLEELMLVANSNGGLRLVPEPAGTDGPPPDTETNAHKIL